MTLPPHLERYDAAFDRIARDAEGIATGLDDIQFSWRPAEDRWSMGECIGHLNVAGYLLLPRLETAIEEARKNGMTSDRPPRLNFMEKRFIRANDPDVRRRRRSPKVYVPSVRHTIDVTIPRFIELQHDLRRVVADAAGLDLRRTRAASPVSRFLKLGIGAWFEATDAHQRRHLRQAQMVRDDPEFPGSAR